ncbi:MAG: porin [Acidobacteriota bacterium]|nr:porin [Acidobacteriota bacterium]
MKTTSVFLAAVLGLLVSAPSAVSALPVDPFLFRPQMFSWAGPEPAPPVSPSFAQEPGRSDSSGKAQSGDSSPAVTASKSVKLSGYTQVQFNHLEIGNDTFTIRRTRVALTGEASRGIKFKFQTDIARTPILLDANVDFVWSGVLNLRVGQFQVPFSMENLTPSSSLDTINRSRPEETLVPSRDNKALGRDIGAMLFGSTGIVEYAFGVFNGPGINQKDNDDHKDLAARLVLRPAGFLHVGVSYYDGKRPLTAGDALVDRDRLGFEGVIRHGGLALKGEYISAWDDDIRRNGWYVQGVYDILPGKAQAVLKYDVLDAEGGLPGRSTSLWTAGVNVVLADKAKFQINYEYYRGVNGGRDNSAVLAFLQAGF